MSDAGARWFILRTSGGQTLPLARSLNDAGFGVWTPARTIRKILRPGKRTEQRIELDVPILPTFVFAPEPQLRALAAAAALSFSPHPAFSVFSHGGSVPFIRDGDVAGLRAEEQRAAETMQAIRDAETHAEAERIRIAAIKSEAARRRATRELERSRVQALRAERRDIVLGSEVTVDEMPALAGVTGVVESSDGAHAWIRFGTQSWKIETWRVAPWDISDHQPRRGIAA